MVDGAIGEDTELVAKAVEPDDKQKYEHVLTQHQLMAEVNVVDCLLTP